MVRVGLALLAAFIQTFPSWLSGCSSHTRTHDLFSSLQIQSLCCGPHPSPFWCRLCSHVWVDHDCHGWDHNCHQCALGICLQPRTSTACFLSVVRTRHSIHELLFCTGSHADGVWCKAEQITQEDSHPVDFFGGWVVLWGQAGAFSTRHATSVLKAKFSNVVTTLTLLHHKTAAPECSIQA